MVSTAPFNVLAETALLASCVSQRHIAFGAMVDFTQLAIRVREWPARLNNRLTESTTVLPAKEVVWHLNRYLSIVRNGRRLGRSVCCVLHGLLPHLRDAVGLSQALRTTIVVW